MRSHVQRLTLIIALVALLAPVALAEGTWRVALGGGRVTGFLGVLARNGLPHEMLSDEELADPSVLAGYDVVIVTAPARDATSISRALAEWVADGGCAITESHIVPPNSVIAGTRRGPAPSANLTFEAHDHPIAQTMHGRGVVRTSSWNGMAIIPGDPDAATVLATFTDQGVPKKHRGKLTGGRRDLPGMLLIEHGEGRWLWSGAPIAVPLALSSLELEPAVLAALEQFSGGDLVPRFVTLENGHDGRGNLRGQPASEFATRQGLQGRHRLLAGVQWWARTEAPTRRREPRDAEPTGPPEGMQTFELPEGAPSSFVLSGTLAEGAEAEMLLPWYTDAWRHTVEVDAGRVRLTEVARGREGVLAEAPRRGASGELVLRRRPHDVTLFIGGQALLQAALEPLAGTIAARGLEDAFLQPTAPVVFEDDFMRTGGAASQWETPGGSWKLYEVEGEPEQGANPFAYRASGEQATAVAGYWFWDDYDFAASVRPNTSAASVLAHRQGEHDHVELRLTLPMDEPAALQLLRVTPEGERLLAAETVDAHRDRWHRLRLRISRGHAVCGLNGRDVLHVADGSLRGRGGIGLRCADGRAFFDDVVVQPWEAAPLAVDGVGPWRAQRGALEAAGDAVAMTPSGSGRALAPLNELADLRAAAGIRLGDADRAGLLVRYRSPADHYLVGLERSGGGVVARVVRCAGGEETVLAERPVSGGPGQWCDLAVTASGPDLQVTSDGATLMTVSDGAIGVGEFALACEGERALFRDVTCWPVDRESHRVDPPTPPYAGIIDLHTWAGAGSGWVPDPTDLDRFWHRGLYVHDVEVRVGVHRVAGGAAAASVLLADDGHEVGYALKARQPALTEPVTVTIMRAGTEVASAEVDAWSSEGFALSLQRVGDLLLARVDGEPVCSFRDPQPLTWMRRVAVRRDEALIDPADIELYSSAVRTYTFEQAPADWRVESGTWEISNRWSCQPQWTWLAGWDQQAQAITRTRWAVTGDQRIDLYVGAKMMPKPEGRGHYEELRDLHFGLCGDGEGGGYHVVLGGDDTRNAVIRRNGETVASNPSYRVPQSERHNNWLLVSLVRHDATLSVRVWDREVVSFTDDEPIEGGFVSMGTEHNGIIIPRVTIYAKPRQATAVN